MANGDAEILTPEGETVAAPRRTRIRFWFQERLALLEETDGHTRIAGAIDSGGIVALYSLADRGHLMLGLPDTSINMIASADLDGDDNDELIAGHNGSDGVAAYSGERVLWRTTNHGNIWTLDAGDLTGDATPEIVHTHSGSTLVVLDAAGAVIRNLRLPIRPYTVRAMPRTGEDDANVFVMDSGQNANGHRLGVVGLNARSVWRRAVRLDDGHRPTVEPAPDASAVAIIAGRDLLVFDNTTGDTIGHATVNDAIGMYWRPADDGTPELYVVTERARYRVDRP